MAGKPKPPRVLRWRDDWYLFYTDPFTGRQQRIRCLSRGATNPKARRNLLQEYTQKWNESQHEHWRGGQQFDYGHPLRDALGLYLKDVKRRQELRDQTGNREGLAPKSARRAREVVKAFQQFVPAWITTGRLDAHLVQRWLREVAATRSGGTVNVYRRTLRAGLRWLALRRPKLFPEPEALWPAFKQAHVEPGRAVALTPDELRAFHDSLTEKQQRVFRFLALTGVRLGEMAGCELRGNVLVIQASKTGRQRYLMLTGAPEGEVAPSLVEQIRTHGIPTFYDRKQWKRRGTIRPQQLRRNFTSYAASLGIPAAVCAMWQGHSLAVAEQFYRQQVLHRLDAESLESAIGFGRLHGGLPKAP